jgi:DNA-binding XRE family transcriptional regulator
LVNPPFAERACNNQEKTARHVLSISILDKPLGFLLPKLSRHVFAEDEGRGDLTPEQAFGGVLQELRRERGLSQEKLAEMSDATQPFISYLEHGKNSPSLKTLFEIAGALGVRPSEIMGRVEAKMEEASRADTSQDT